MSDLIRLRLVGDFKARVLAVVPGARAHLAALDALIAEDRFVTDDGLAHADLVAWVETVQGRGPASDAVPVVGPVVGPVGPVSGGAGALVGGAV